jgi:uncharacterized protein (DUF433 family)
MKGSSTSAADRTAHPHIARLEGVCGGEPVIDGLRVTVRHVATLLRGETIPEIAEALGPTEVQDFHGLSDFAHHREEITAPRTQEEQAHTRFSRP